MNTYVQHVVDIVEVEKHIIQEKINQETKRIEVPHSQFIDKAVEISVVAQRQARMNRKVQKTIEIPQLQYTDDVVGVPVVSVVQAPLVRAVMKTVETPRVQIVAETTEIPQLPLVEKIVMIPEIQTIQGPQTSESLSVDSKGLSHQDCEVLFHVNKQSPGIAGGVHVDRDDLHAGNGARTAAAAQHRSTQQRKQWQQPRKEEGEKKGREEREKGRKGQRGSGQEGRKKEEGREAEEGGGEQVEKDLRGWTEVTRKRRRKTVQIFVKVDGCKVTPMEVSLTDDKVEDVMRQVQKDEDKYVTMHGRVLRRNEKLKSCGVTDGCTIQVTSRLRSGGKHKDKKSKAEKRQVTSQKAVSNEGPAILESKKEAIIRMWEENEGNRKFIQGISEGSDVEMEQTLQIYRAAGREALRWDQGQADIMECGLRWAVEARRKARRQQEEEQRRQGEQGWLLGQEESKQDKQVDDGDDLVFLQTTHHVCLWC